MKNSNFAGGLRRWLAQASCSYRGIDRLTILPIEGGMCPVVII